MLFKKKAPERAFDREKKRPALRCSICTGEQVAGFKDKKTGAFEEIMLIQNGRDLQKFRETYGIRNEEIEKFY